MTGKDLPLPTPPKKNVITQTPWTSAWKQTCENTLRTAVGKFWQKCLEQLKSKTGGKQVPQDERFEPQVSAVKITDLTEQAMGGKWILVQMYL